MTTAPVNIRPYDEKDEVAVRALMGVLQQHIADIDPHRLNKSAQEFDLDAYMSDLFNEMEKFDGTMMVAETGDAMCGFIAGIIERDGDSPDHVPMISGRIKELVVDPSIRSGGIGTKLVREMEGYFREKGADFSIANCFGPNVGAHAFYEKNGYSDRSIDLLKKLVP